MRIIRGTTPTIQFTFSQIDPTDIVTAYLVIKQDGVAMITKPLTEATVDGNAVSFVLSQEETLGLRRRSGTIVLDWKAANGVRGRSAVCDFDTGEPGKNEVI